MKLWQWLKSLFTRKKKVTPIRSTPTRSHGESESRHWPALTASAHGRHVAQQSVGRSLHNNYAPVKRTYTAATPVHQVDTGLDTLSTVLLIDALTDVFDHNDTPLRNIDDEVRERIATTRNEPVYESTPSVEPTRSTYTPSPEPTTRFDDDRSSSFEPSPTSSWGGDNGGGSSSSWGDSFSSAFD
ncbi:hypothetical protein MZD04_gp281 [Pseudomonas phage Psa21]|uniref:Uncharacterized protein n=1 Tax=Pseudomonas phage Psa21 TaxID=2530023 RepID=A0A481W6H0_9CAUD|nr:hypothetical protein MZD04_gp281 [Pseudomonas phage Psa21]QBJ02807.1 hypothetical protein PSA21_281 [Pseudomonas phage Psa21]